MHYPRSFLNDHPGLNGRYVLVGSYQRDDKFNYEGMMHTFSIVLNTSNTFVKELVWDALEQEMFNSM